MRKAALVWIALSSLASGCSSAELSREYDAARDLLEIRLGPFRVSTLGRVYMTARFSREGLHPPGASAVEVSGSFIDSLGLAIVADDRRFRYTRVRFRSFLVRIPFEDFKVIGRAGTVGLSFDADFRDASPYWLDREEIERLHEFTSLVEHDRELARRRRERAAAGKRDGSEETPSAEQQRR